MTIIFPCSDFVFVHFIGDLFYQIIELIEFGMAEESYYKGSNNKNK